MADWQAQRRLMPGSRLTKPSTLPSARQSLCLPTRWLHVESDCIATAFQSQLLPPPPQVC